MGVDVFFVISGFLITGIILSDLENKSFSFLDFYERRIRRIFPALYLVMTLCIVPTLFFLLPDESKDFFQSAGAMALFSSNILFFTEEDYFSRASELKPLLHTWSLSVEEQFYIVIPLVMLIIHKIFNIRVLFIVMILILASSFSYAYVMYSKDPTFAFYMLPTRMWELLIGSMGAFYIKNTNKQGNTGKVIYNVLSGVGLALVVYALLGYDKNNSSVILYILMATFGTILILLYANKGTVVQKILSFKGFVSVGVISYSLYLFHQPIIAYTHLLSVYEITIFDKVLILLATAILSYLNWKYVEQYFRNRINFKRKTIFSLAGITILTFITLGLVADKKEGLYVGNGKNGVTYEEIESVLSFNIGLVDVCNLSVGSPLCKTNENPQVILWGDSYAMHLVQAMQNSATKIGFEQITHVSCSPALGKTFVEDLNEEMRATCIKRKDKAIDYILKQPVDIVVLSSPFDFLESDYTDASKNLLKTVDALRRTGKKVVIVSPPPGTGKDLGVCFKNITFRNLPQNICEFSKSKYSRRTKNTYKLLKSIEATVPIIWLDKFLCSGDVCSIIADGIPIYRDSGHLSKSGSAHLGRKYDIMGQILLLAK